MSLEAGRSVAISLKATLDPSDPNYATVVEFANQLEVANANLRALQLYNNSKGILGYTILPNVSSE